MNPPPNSAKLPDAESLRALAEARVQKRQESIESLSDQDARALAHELSVHQVELEIQNESLRETESHLQDLYERYRDLYENASVGYLSLSAHRVIRSANLTAASLLGRERSQLLNQPLESLAAPEWVDDCYLHCKRTLLSGQAEVLQAEFLRSDGTRFWVRLESRPLAHAEGDVACQVVLSDISHTKEAEQLRESQERLEMALDAACLGTWRINLLTGRAWWDGRLYSLLKRNPQAPVTMDTFFDYIHPDDRSRVRAEVDQVIAQGEEYTGEFRMLREDGALCWMAAHGKVFRDTEGKAVRMSGINYDITNRKELESLRQESHNKLEARVRERTSELRAMTRRLMTAQEDERRRIAQGLHDEVGQILTACQLKLAGLGDLLPEHRKAEIDEIDDLLTSAVELIRDLIFELALPTLERAGFAAAARELCQKLQQKEGVAIVWEEAAHNHVVPADVAGCLYHCLRELLYNVTRHAESGKATVSLECQQTSLRLVVHDDGKGFDSKALSTGLTRTKGFGLHNIRERVDSLGGQLEIDSIPDDGTRVEIRLPLSRTHEKDKEDLS